jgi:PAS domain S-box-containing protein
MPDDSDLLDAMLEAIPQGVYFKDLQSRFIRASYALANALQLKGPAEMLGKTDFDFLSGTHARAAREDEEQVIRTNQGIINKEERFTQPNGDLLWVLTTKMPLRNREGEVIGTFGLSRDITELKLAQENLALAHEQLRNSYEELKKTQMQLIAAEKAAVVGRLAAGLAHEVKNPLAMIRLGIEYLQQSAESEADQTQQTVLNTIWDGIERADTMIGALQTFANSGEVHMECEDLNSVARSAIDLVEEECSRRAISVVTLFSKQMPRVSMDREKITQVLHQLLTNAVQAVSEGGTITVATLAKQLTRTEVSRNPGDRTGLQFRAHDGVVVVEITDSGPGIAPDVLPKIFDPFFTTKPTDQGAGLGLTLSKKLMELQGGDLRVGNRDQGGAVATVLLKVDGATD